MSSQFIDFSAPSLQGPQPKRPEDLPHGLITPPQEVRDLVADDKARFPSEVYTAEVEERVLNDWTLQHYFDYLGYEVAYRQTPQGPEVLAVGLEEDLALRKRIGEEEYRRLQTWLP